MSLFVISDLHLSIGSGTDKPMDVFGARWQGYLRKLERNWRAVVTDRDDVVIPGDISWAMKLSEAADDMKFLDSLPGTKYIGKGNHDFWWSTASKMNNFFDENGISSVRILYNNAYRLETSVICGTRGWFTDQAQQHTVGDVDYAKIVNREAQRLRLSLEQARRLRGDDNTEILVFLHFPPVFRDYKCDELISVLREYGIRRCFFGHIHGVYNVPRSFVCDGITMTLISADFLDFAVLPVFSEIF